MKVYDKQVDSVVCPHFTYHGFRYIRLEGVGEEVAISHFMACVLHTDMELTSHFSSNHPLANQLQQNIEWTQRCNFLDIPTDCPQRDERLGWTGDAQIFSSTAMYQFNAALFYKKWLRDMAIESSSEKGIPQVVPNFMGATQGTSIWGDVANIIPWNLYQIYGDKDILATQYENIRLWVDYITQSSGESILWKNGFQRGDWLGLDYDASLSSFTGGTDKHLIANIYYAYSCRIVRDTAKILGFKDDEQNYSALYERIVLELNQEYVTQRRRLVSETQTACALLLHFHLVNEKYRAKVIDLLEDNINRHQGHLTTGFVGTAYLFHTLSENGLHYLAERMFLSSDYPGWFYAIKRGATTIWERWNSILPNGDFEQSGMNSLNHYTYGSIGDWIYRKIVGINALEPGYHKILIKPYLTKGLSEVRACYQSMYGEIKIDYTCQENQFTIAIDIPANTSAILDLPELKAVISVGSGHWEYSYPVQMNLKIEKFSLQSKVSEILEDQQAAVIFKKEMKGAVDEGMLSFLSQKTLNELIALAPNQKGLVELIVDKINHLDG